MSTPKRYLLVLLAVIITVIGSIVWADCCISPDNGKGTVDLPAAVCQYLSENPGPVIQVPGTSSGVGADFKIDSFFDITYLAGPSGGEIEQFGAALTLDMQGNGSLSTFNRSVTIPIQCKWHANARTPGQPVQSFDTEMLQLQGQLPPGDPDFDLLRITAGTDFNLPCPGHTTLTQLPGGNWAVDSFFDITYRIDFVGDPQGKLSKMSGSTTATIRISTCNTSNAGDICWNVDCGGAQYDANESPIPADFFGPGSEPFSGIIYLGGGDPNGPDVIVRRLESMNFTNPLPSSDQVPIELVQLNLVSCEPITVTYRNGLIQKWDISAALHPLPSPHGQMNVLKTDPNGGVFTFSFSVQPVFTFTKVGGIDVRVFDAGIIQLVSDAPVVWQDTSPKSTLPCNSQGFYPGCSESMVMSDASGEFGIELLSLCRVIDGMIAIDGLNGWKSALGTTVKPVKSQEWDQYMAQWQQYLQDGNGYPANIYSEPNLYVWAGGDVQDMWPSRPGLVMVWGGSILEGSICSAWKYHYPDDPDLSNMTITVTVLPPYGMNAVSFAFRDINGNIRAWYWNVSTVAGPGVLQCGVPTAVTLDTLITGTSAATPAAAGYMSNPSFDITQVQDILVDENWQWVGGAQPVPPPGQVVPKVWNFWYNLVVTPNISTKPADPVKWSQPPVEIGPRTFLGWDERSVRDYRPLLADDWLCEDDRPITDIHWWGSFVRWNKSTLPSQAPIAFHFGIWTDIPKDSATPFSHPGTLIWEYTCRDFKWNFAGYDKDPRGKVTAVSLATDGTIVPTINDSCFQFNCNLPDDKWFHQQPQSDCRGTVYWLSISAIYPNGTKPLYPWGWKTRPHFFNDDAVRIYQITGTPWPATVGASWVNGQPIEYPAGLSWDLAFELTTNKILSQAALPDDKLNKIKDFRDFVIVATQWLANK